ncbi:MAG: NUDIX domain-containing protein [Lapillicoccus sp.]
MTSGGGTVVVVVGVDDAGTELTRFDLAHGADPEESLAASGLVAARLVAVGGHTEPHVVELRYRVEGAGPQGSGIPGGSSGVVRRTVVRDADLHRAPDEEAYVFQRVAVYAVLRSDRGLLLTQMSDRTNARGRWGLAGGGLDAGEEPEAALHREVWEESGQRVDRLQPWRVTTSHWVGRAPSGRLEDFHAVRVVYAAWCAEPTEPVVHDVGGTTQASAWFAATELEGLPLVTSWSSLLADLPD